jgi:putative transposase
MCSLFRNRYRVESARLKEYNYARDGKYFITICTKNRIHYFGELMTGKMVLSEIGEIAYKFWMEIPDHFPLVEIDEFIVMPNHLHGIMIINRKIVDVETPKLGVSTMASSLSSLSKSQSNNTVKQTSKYKSKTIGLVINQYKRICTINIRKIDPSFSWQSRYYDHIIRTRTELKLIQKYILSNPGNSYL